jgi:two-component system sensor histidine kinase ArlS
MPVRLRITLLFLVLVMFILGMVCGGIYYFSYTARVNTMERRLTNRAITTAKLLNQSEIFDQSLVQRIHSLTTIALKDKTVQAYDFRNNKIYSYSDVPGDTLQVNKNILDDARINGTHFFEIGDKEAVAYHDPQDNAEIVVVSAAEDEDGKQNLHTLRNILLFSFLVGISIVLVTGYIFSSRLLQPIKKITSDVEEISAQNLARRLKTGGARDEWFQLANTLNQLLNRLQESFELQRRFISNASHELSTPLTSISSQLEVSFQREREAKEYKEVMQSIYQDVRHMSKLTKTLLEFAKASGNTGGLEINLIRIDEIILRLPSEMAKINPQYSVSLQFEKLPENDESLLVFGNEELLLTAIKNIVLNACKYSDNHQAVVLLEIQEKRIMIAVSDQGKGIPENELKTIFQPFYRVGENKTNEGFGLGLSLTERIIKLHKGSIEVSSQINVGTRFIILLPPARSLR